MGFFTFERNPPNYFQGVKTLLSYAKNTLLLLPYSLCETLANEIEICSRHTATNAAALIYNGQLAAAGLQIPAGKCLKSKKKKKNPAIE